MVVALHGVGLIAWFHQRHRLVEPARPAVVTLQLLPLRPVEPPPLPKPVPPPPPPPQPVASPRPQRVVPPPRPPAAVPVVREATAEGVFRRFVAEEADIDVLDHMGMIAACGRNMPGAVTAEWEDIPGAPCSTWSRRTRML